MSASLLAVDHGRRPRFGLVLPPLAAAALLAACQREVEKPAPEIRPVRTVADIHAAKAENRTGIIIGWQMMAGNRNIRKFIK